MCVGMLLVATTIWSIGGDEYHGYHGDIYEDVQSKENVRTRRNVVALGRLRLPGAFPLPCWLPLTHFLGPHSSIS